MTNPILARETRSRWRDGRSFTVLLGLCLILAVVSLWAYGTSANLDVQNSLYAGTGYGAPMIDDLDSQLGRSIFHYITLLGTLVWLIIPFIFAAPTISGERERGLLQEVWLTRMAPRELIGGRIGALLIFVICLQLTTLPFLALGFLLGGISPAEFLISLALQFSAALLSTSLGLWASARSSRPTTAFTTGFTVMALWAFAVFLLDSVLGFTGVLDTPLNPFSGASRLGGAPLHTGQMGLNELCLLNIAAQLLLSLALLLLAVPAMLRPLTQALWQEKNPHIEAWRRRLNQSIEKRTALRQERVRMRERAGQALLFELPLSRLIRFKNPLLQREVRVRFKIRRAGLLISLARFAVFLLAAGVWLAVLSTTFDNVDRFSAGTLGINALAVGGALAVAVMATSAFTRDRESGTWEGVRLSLLRPRDVLLAKWAAPLIITLYAGIPILVLLPFSLPWGRQNGFPIAALLGGLLLTTGALALISTLGLWLSWHCRTTAIAMSWLLALLIVSQFGIPFAARSWYLPAGLILTPLPAQTYSYSSYGQAPRKVLPSGSPMLVAFPLLLLNDLTGNDSRQATSAGSEMATNLTLIAGSFTLDALIAFALLALLSKSLQNETRSLRLSSAGAAPSINSFTR